MRRRLLVPLVLFVFLFTNMSVSYDDKITIVREYFIRAEQGRPDVLDLFQEDAEIYFPKFGFGFGRQSFFEMARGFEGALEYIQHDYDFRWGKNRHW